MSLTLYTFAPNIDPQMKIARYKRTKADNELLGLSQVYHCCIRMLWIWPFLAHLTQRVKWAIVTTERPSSVVRPSVRPLTFHILINSSEATGPIWTKLWWNGPWMAPFQNCVRWSQLPTKMVAKLKIEKRGDEILIVHCCFSISQNELKF